MTENNVINENIADGLLKRVGELLGGEVNYYRCFTYDSDKKTEHRKIVIEYDHRNKDNG